MFNLTTKEIRYLQRSAGVKVDGVLGPKTYAAMRRSYDGSNYKNTVAGFIQLTINERLTTKVNVDGIFGPITDARLHKLVYGSYAKAPKAHDVSAGIIIPQRPVWTKELPRTTKQKMRYYGKPGTNLTRMTFPLKMYYGGKLVKTTRVNTKCKEFYLHRYEMLLNHFGQTELDRLRISDFGGLTNVRKVRGGTSWSSHAFGCADDTNASANRMRQRADTARFAKKEYQAYWDIVYKSGATSLGLEKGYDFMHASYIG